RLDGGGLLSHSGHQGAGALSLSEALRRSAGRADLPGAHHAPHRNHQPSVARAVVVAAALRQHLRRGSGHPDSVQPLSVSCAAAAPPVVSPAAGTPGGTELIKWTIITAGFALAIAAAFGALGQSRGLAAAVEGIARNPSAAGEIRGNLILGLVLIESLVIYVLL